MADVAAFLKICESFPDACTLDQSCDLCETRIRVNQFTDRLISGTGSRPPQMPDSAKYMSLPQRAKMS